jgi:nitrous oxidase accessory protein NosD
MYFISNSVHAYDGAGTNFWDYDSGYPLGGNYWDDYGGSDGNGDKIGDTPYTGIQGGMGAKDNYPWMIPNGWP